MPQQPTPTPVLNKETHPATSPVKPTVHAELNKETEVVSDWQTTEDDTDTPSTTVVGTTITVRVDGREPMEPDPLPDYAPPSKSGGNLFGGTSPDEGPEYRWAAVLLTYLQKTDKITADYKIADWRKEFVQLRKFRTADDIERVLRWYVYRIGVDYMQQAYCARTFRIKFAKIEAAMKGGKFN